MISQLISKFSQDLTAVFTNWLFVRLCDGLGSVTVVQKEESSSPGASSHRHRGAFASGEAMTLILPTNL